MTEDKNICPFCGAGLSKDQPQIGTHGYTDVYECGTKIDKAFGYHEYADTRIKCLDLDLLSKD